VALVSPQPELRRASVDTEKTGFEDSRLRIFLTRLHGILPGARGDDGAAESTCSLSSTTGTAETRDTRWRWGCRKIFERGREDAPWGGEGRGGGLGELTAGLLSGILFSSSPLARGEREESIGGEIRMPS
jgi:hypothetical protein